MYLQHLSVTDGDRTRTIQSLPQILYFASAAAIMLRRACGISAFFDKRYAVTVLISGQLYCEIFFEYSTLSRGQSDGFLSSVLLPPKKVPDQINVGKERGGGEKG